MPSGFSKSRYDAPVATCSSCGFLAIRGVDGDLIEVDDLYRRQAKRDPASRPHADVDEWRRLPLCFMRKYNLAREILEQWGTDSQPATLKTILAERDCDAWTEWQQGFTPKEHREMLDRQEMLEWQAEREDADRRWRKTQADDERQWRAGQAAEERNWRWAQILIFGVAGGIVAIVAALIGKT